MVLNEVLRTTNTKIIDITKDCVKYLEFLMEYEYMSTFDRCFGIRILAEELIQLIEDKEYRTEVMNNVMNPAPDAKMLK